MVPASPMTRSVCCLALALSVAACVPPKATVVEEPPAPAPRKPANVPSGPAAPEVEPRVTQESGMRVPTRLIERLPDRRDMTPTADPKPGGAIAIPPTADKRDNR
jgi:hypothetical protein